MRASQTLRAFMAGARISDAPDFADWDPALQTALTLLLGSEAQIVMFSGPDYRAWYNDAYAPTIGDKHPAALGQPAHLHWHELWEDLRSLLDQVRLSGAPVTARDRPFYIERFGYPETVYFDIAFSPLQGADGQVAAVFCIVSETTTRIEAARRLRENESQMQAIVTGAAAGLCTVSHTGHIITANQHFATMIGRQVSDLPGCRLRDLIDPRDWQDNWLARHTSDGALRPVELRYLREDGRRIWVSQAMSQIEDSREPQGWAFCLLTTDITARRLGEIEMRRMAAIIEGSDDAILAVDLSMKITSWNRGAQRLYGYAEGEVLGRSVQMLLPKGREDEEAAILGRIRSGARIETYETTRVCRDGRVVPVSLTVSPIYDGAGEVIGASKIARDISSRREAERMQEFLLYEMKHRVKNILATVLALARQTMGKLGLPEYITFRDRIHALSRTQDLLTRKDTGSVALAALVGEVLAPFAPEQFRITGPALQLPAGAVLPVTLALHELVTNAMKYGALSVPGGLVEMNWQITPGSPGSPDQATILWRESGGPKVAPPRRAGFGTVLIRDLLASSLRAEIALEFPETGVAFTARFPLEDPGAAPP